MTNRLGLTGMGNSRKGENTMNEVIRQGDVLLRAIAKPDKLGKVIAKGTVVLARGEVTGHAHVIEGAIAEFLVGGERVLWVEQPAPLTHQEHTLVEVPPAWYVVETQREYT